MPGQMNPGNGWVKYTELIPWDALIEVYISIMSRKKGRKGVHPRLAIGAAGFARFNDLLLEKAKEARSKA